MKNLLFIILLCAAMACSTESYYTVHDYAEVPKADVHIHIRTDRDVFVKKAKEDNFKLVNIVVDGAGTWENIHEQFAYAMTQQQAHPDQLRTVTAFSVEGFHEPGWSEEVIDWLDSCFAEGAIGIKVWKNIGMVLKDTNEVNVMLNDNRFDAIFDYLIAEDKLVVGHLGEPKNCWLPLDEMTTNNDRNYFRENPQYHMHLYPELPSYEDQISARNHRLDKDPELTFVGAHMASLEWSVDRLADWFDQYPEATIDLAARMGQVFYQTRQDREKVREFFIKYQDRIMYATDMGDGGGGDPKALANRMESTWKRDWRYFVTDDTMNSDLIEGEFRGLKLPRTVVDKIYYTNAARVFDF